MYIYGKNVVEEAMKKKEKIQKVYLQENFNDQNLKLLIQKLNVPIKICSKRELDQLAKGNHQGIIVSVPEFQYQTLNSMIAKEDAFVLILDHLEDPHNLGAIIRTAEAAGVDGIILPKDRSVSVNSTVIKVSTGAIEHMKMTQVTNLVRTMEELKKQGFWIIGTDMEGTSYEELDYHGKIALVIGNEGNGMSRLVRESCGFIVCIPMFGKTNSLNASVATGILIYGALRNRK